MRFLPFARWTSALQSIKALDYPDLGREQHPVWDHIQPVLEVGRAALVLSKLGAATIDLSGATSVVVTGFTVPSGKRWRVKLINRPLVSTAAPTQGIFIGDGTNSMQVVLVNALLAINFAHTELVMESGWTIGFGSTFSAFNSAVVVTCVYSEEDTPPQT